MKCSMWQNEKAIESLRL